MPLSSRTLSTVDRQMLGGLVLVLVPNRATRDFLRILGQIWNLDQATFARLTSSRSVLS